MRWIQRIPGYQPIEYSPTEDEGEVRRHQGDWHNPGIMTEVEADVRNDKTVMILASCERMLYPIVRDLRARGLPFHNPHRLKNTGVESAPAWGEVCVAA